MKVTAKLAAAVLLAAASGTALAAEGAFVSADVGPASYSAGGSSPIAVRVGGGYNFVEIPNANLTIGAEGAVADFGSATGGIFNTTFSYKTQGVMANGRVTWEIPNAKGLGIFGKVGVIYARTDSTVFIPGFGFISGTSSTSNLFFGAGVKYDFTKNWGVHAQYEDFGGSISAANGATSNLTLFSAGATYSF